MCVLTKKNVLYSKMLNIGRFSTLYLVSGVNITVIMTDIAEMLVWVDRVTLQVCICNRWKRLNIGFFIKGRSMLEWNKTSCVWGINEILYLFQRLIYAIMYGIWHRSNVRCGFSRWHGSEWSNFQWLCCIDPAEFERWHRLCWL